MRPGEPLLAERYITNPQYGVYGAGNAVPGTPGAMDADDTNKSQVQLLDRNALTFLEEVGEGCFGKVHKGKVQAVFILGFIIIIIYEEKILKSSSIDISTSKDISFAIRLEEVVLYIKSMMLMFVTGLLRTTADEQVVAIKVLKETAGRNAEEDFVREVSIMSAFRHPNILALVGVVYRGT